MKKQVQNKSFEECYPNVLKEIQKRKNKWTLTSISAVSYEDIQQIILLHIWKKWHLFDQKRSLGAWLNIIIANQIKNLIRNNYQNFSRPCLRCDASTNNDSCKIYSSQCNNCPSFKLWQQRKLPAMNIRLPLSIENHQNEIHAICDSDPNIHKDIEKAHIAMKKILKPFEYEVYEGLFIRNEDETTVAKKLGYITNEAKRAPGYKQIKNLRKVILSKFKKALKDGMIDIW
jgi:hypothetical protein